MRALPWAAALLLVPTGAALAIEEAEQRERIEFETRAFEEQIGNSGHLFDDPALDAYLQGIVDTMFPDQRGTLRVRTFRNPEFNAFAVATGGVYFHTGTLLRMEDESQLASVLGHEGTHVTADHIYRSVKGAKSTAKASIFLGMIAAGAGLPPVLGSIVGLSSMAGFSREHEREADRGGFDRMVQAGYSPRGGAEAFARLERELKARHVTQGGYFFASHPRVQERVETQTEFAQGVTVEGERYAERYREITLNARLDALVQLHRAGDGKTLVFLLGDENLLASLPLSARFYLAEGYRLRSEAARKARADTRSKTELQSQRDEDAERAIEEYRRTIAEAPEYGPPYQALAMHHLRAGDKPQALALFTRYVELTPDPKQSGYARQYIDKLNKELAP